MSLAARSALILLVAASSVLSWVGCSGRTSESTECSESQFCPANSDCLDTVCVARTCADFDYGISCVIPGRGLGQCTEGVCAEARSTPDGGIDGVLLSGVVWSEQRASTGAIWGLALREGVTVSVIDDLGVAPVETDADGSFEMEVPKNTELVLRLDNAGFAPAATRIFSILDQDFVIEDPLMILTAPSWGEFRRRGDYSESGSLVLVSYANIDDQQGADKRASFMVDPACDQEPSGWTFSFEGPVKVDGPAPYGIFASCSGEHTLTGSHAAYQQCIVPGSDSGFRIRGDLGLNVFAGWFRCF